MPSLFYAGQPDYIEKLNTLATAASMTNGTVAASFLSLAVTGTATAASFVGPLTGNASTATTLATARNINGVSFNGSADITVTAAAGTLTGATLNPTVTASSLTSVGTLTALTVTGSVGVGGAAFTSAKLMLSGTAPASGTLSFGNYNGLTLDPTVTSSAYLNYTVPAIATGGTVGTLAHYFVAQGVFTGTATNQYGFAVGSAMTGATNNFGFHSAIASGANRWNFYAAGTAANYFQGDTTFASQASFAAGTAAAPSVKVGGEQNGLFSSTANTLDVTVGGLRQARFMNVASAVNYGQLQGASTGFAPIWSSQGSDTNINWIATSKGSGGVLLYTNLGTALQLVVAHTASAVNYIQATGAATGGAPSFAVGGTDTNIPFAYYTKGTGTHQFFANGGLQMLIGAPASSVNYWQFFGAAAAGALSMYADGSDTNIAVVQNTKGTGSHFFRTNGGAQTQFVVSHTASAVNYLQATGSTTGNEVRLSVQGTDTNAGMWLTTKGTGVIRMETGGGEQFRVAHTASAVNYWDFTGAATGNGIRVDATGSDSGVNGFFVAKGSGVWNFCTSGSSGNRQFQIGHIASAVNYAQITGSATGNAVTAAAAGSDSNIDFAITPKGTGVLRFGTHSALAAETVTGYITVKDSAGNTRKLAVLS